MAKDIRKVLIISLIIILLIGLIIGVGLYFSHRIRNIASIGDKSKYDATKEIELALQRLSAEDKKAEIIKKIDAKEKVIALSFQGLSDPDTNEKVLALISKYKRKVNFFISGIMAAENSDLVKEIHNKGHRIGSNTLIPSVNMQKLSQEELIDDFVRANIIFQEIIREKPDTLLCNSTIYTNDLLKAAYASGNKMVVQPTKYISYQSFKDYEQVLGYVSRLDKGSIITVKMDGVLEEGEYDKAQEPAKPAIDKQAGVAHNESMDELTPEERLINTVDWLLEALGEAKYKVVFVEDLDSYRSSQLNEEEIEEKKDHKEEGSSKKETGWRIDRIQKDNFNIQDISPGELEKLRLNNKGQKAKELHTIHTTEKALSYAFYGISNGEVLDKVLNNLDILEAKATFFIGKKDLINHRDQVKRIAEAGHELGISLVESQDRDFYSVLNSILLIQKGVKELTGQATNLVRYPYYLELDEEILEAISSGGSTVVWEDLAIASSKVGKEGNLEAVLENAFNEGNYTARRGYIIYFRMDYYTNPDIISQAMLKIAEDRIYPITYQDGIADNGSSYSIKAIGTIIKGEKIYNYPLNDHAILPSVKDRIYSGYLSKYSDEERFNYIKARYIGNPDISSIKSLPGFNEEELEEIDKTGIFTDDRVLFLTFDDWASDKAINHILYVLDKHGVKGSFFIRTNYIQNNPNILRAIGEAGHDVASHSDAHLPFAIYKANEDKDGTSSTYYSLNKEEIMERRKDLQLSYNKLQYVIGDIAINNQHPVLTPLFRPPTLTMSREGMETILDLGFSYIVSGDFNTHDYEYTAPEILADEIINGMVTEGGRQVKIQNGSILIMHMSDFKQTPLSSPNVTAKALDIVIPKLKEMGYSFAKLSDYLR